MTVIVRDPRVVHSKLKVRVGRVNCVRPGIRNIPGAKCEAVRVRENVLKIPPRGTR